MLKIITTLTMFAIGLLAQAQVSESKTVSPFSKIEISNGVELIYTESQKASITAEASTAKALTTLVVRFTGKTLSISKTSSEPVKVYVAASGVKAIRASQGATVKITNQLSADNISVAMVSGSVFNGTIVSEKASLAAKSESIMNVRVQTKNLAGNFAGKSKVNLSGAAHTATINSQSGALCHARNFIADQVSVIAESESDVSIYAGHDLNICATDRAKVTYFGTPGKVMLTPETMMLRKISGNGRLVTEN